MLTTNMALHFGSYFADTSYWSELDKKFGEMYNAADQFVQICQKYWYIPMAFALVAIAVLILAGGREGRVRAKSAIWWVLVATIIIGSIPSIASLIANLSGNGGMLTPGGGSGGTTNGSTKASFNTPLLTRYSRWFTRW